MAKLSQSYRDMHAAVYKFHEQHCDIPDTETAFNDLLKDGQVLSNQFKRHPFVDAMIIAVYNELGRAAQDDTDKQECAS